MMKFAKVKAFGKLNIGLNIKGVEGSYHALETVMAEINFFDVITVKTRRDDKINVSVKSPRDFNVDLKNNNVFKTAKLFAEKFQTGGADITLKKNIPVGSGLGGSSADIVGVARALAKAYDIEDDLTDFVNSLCSDGEFLLKGGCALVEGRGQVVKKINMKNPLYAVIVIPETDYSTTDVFAEFDKGDYVGDRLDVSDIVSFIEDDKKPFNKNAFNALYSPACRLNSQISDALDDILSLSPIVAGMSGSGSAVYGFFDSPDLCFWAKGKLEEKWDRVVVKETVIK